MSKLRQRHSYTFVGNQFTGLNTILKDSPMVGYYTDASLDNMRAATQFAQAQLILAPTILDLNNTQHEFVILVCSSPNMAIEKIHSLGLQPLKVSPSGIILARNPTRKTLMQGDIPANLKPITNRQRP